MRKVWLAGLKTCSFIFCFLPSFQPMAPQIFTGLIFQTLFPGAILPTSQANPDVQNGILPAGQAGINPANHGTLENRFPTPSGTDDDFEVTTPAGVQRAVLTTEETTTGSPNGKFSQLGKCPWATMKIIGRIEHKSCLAFTNTDPNNIREPLSSLTVDCSNVKECFYWPTNPDRRHFIAGLAYFSSLSQSWKCLETDCGVLFPSPLVFPTKHGLTTDTVTQSWYSWMSLRAFLTLCCKQPLVIHWSRWTLVPFSSNGT